MANQDPERQHQRADEDVRRHLPVGVELSWTLRGHSGTLGRIAWSPDGMLLAAPASDGEVVVWDVNSGAQTYSATGHHGAFAVAFDASGRTVASAGLDGHVRLWSVGTDASRVVGTHHAGAWAVTYDFMSRHLVSGGNDGVIRIWDVNGRLIASMNGHHGSVNAVAIDSKNKRLVSGSIDTTVGIWDLERRMLVNQLHGHRSSVLSVDVSPTAHLVASGNQDASVRLWDLRSGALVRELEGHTGVLQCVAFAPDGAMLASKAADGTVRLWDTATGACLATLGEPTGSHPYNWAPGLAFSPSGRFLATVGSDPYAPDHERDGLAHIYRLNASILRGSEGRAISYTSAKIVLVGDSGVGKTALGWRLAHGGFKEHASTHGQQFWLMNQLGEQRPDGVQCEAVLWDLAGQVDYRLIHALFLDDADLALVLFDPMRDEDRFGGVDFWLAQLRIATGRRRRGAKAVLIAARADRGMPRLTRSELNEFCENRGISAYVPTSAKSGEGIEELIEHMRRLIEWDEKPATITTETFKRIKDFVLELKGNVRRRKVILTPAELRRRLEGMDTAWEFGDDEMLAAVGHLANHGYVTVLKTSQGMSRILLAPELLNNLASSFVMEARRNNSGLGSLEERDLFDGVYSFPELDAVTPAEKEVLIDAAAGMFLEHHLCFRETDPLSGRAYLVFPELINQTMPETDEARATDEGTSYTVSGAVENVYASLVVLMGYTRTFSRTNQWRNHARYEMAQGFVCGFRQNQERKRPGEVEFDLYYSSETPLRERNLFENLFESFLARRNLTFRRFEPAKCPLGHVLNRSVVREQVSQNMSFAFCGQCGARVLLKVGDDRLAYPVVGQADDVEADRVVADRRSRFEQVLYRLKAHASQCGSAPPSCFISYAWGNADQEKWVEKSLATDLLKAGVGVILDRWENSRIGSSVPRFIERIGASDFVVVVGTPRYRLNYENNLAMRSFVSAAEGEMIGGRLIATKESGVLPVLLNGTKEESFPYLLHSRVYADFREEGAYFTAALELLLSIYAIKPTDALALDLRASL